MSKRVLNAFSVRIWPSVTILFSVPRPFHHTASLARKMQSKRDKDLQEFMDWVASQKCIESSNLELRTSPFGHGMFARKDIHTGEEIASIPLQLVLTVGAARESPTGQTLLPILSKVPGGVLGDDDDLRLLLYAFMIEQRRQPDGLWGPYLRSLPTVYQDPLWWDERDLAMLRGTALERAVPNRLAKLRRQYEAVFPQAIQHNPSLFTAHVFTFPDKKGSTDDKEGRTEDKKGSTEDKEGRTKDKKGSTEDKKAVQRTKKAVPRTKRQYIGQKGQYRGPGVAFK
eukprot:g58142.t1